MEAIYYGIYSELKKKSQKTRNIFDFFINISKKYYESKKILDNTDIYTQHPTKGEIVKSVPEEDLLSEFLALIKDGEGIDRV